jgi:ketosteroid isomerase-like protein
MTTQEVANRYMDLFKQGKASEIQDTLYDADVICVEPEHAASQGIPTLTRGLEAIKAKTKARQETIAELHSFYCTEPSVGGGYFSMAMGRELTFKNGQRRKVDEIAVFGVKDGKIVSETFYY